MNDNPKIDSFPIGEQGHVRCYLALKIDDEYAE
jgi:hypothetical protein